MQCTKIHFFTKSHLLNILLVFQELSNNSAKLALLLRWPKVMILIIFDALVPLTTNDFGWQVPHTSGSSPSTLADSALLL